MKEKETFPLSKISHKDNQIEEKRLLLEEALLKCFKLLVKEQQMNFREVAK